MTHEPPNGNSETRKLCFSCFQRHEIWNKMPQVKMRAATSNFFTYGNARDSGKLVFCKSKLQENYSVIWSHTDLVIHYFGIIIVAECNCDHFYKPTYHQIIETKTKAKNPILIDVILIVVKAKTMTNTHWNFQCY